MKPFLCLISAFWLALSVSGADKPALDVSGWNKEARPQDDFFEFANGGWLKNTEIPSDKTRWGSFVILAEESRDAVQAIIDELSAKDGLEHGSNAQKIRDLYRSFMNEDRVEELGVSPLLPFLDAVNGIENKNEFGDIWARAGTLGISNPIGAFINQDGKDSTRYALYFTQSGLGLPDRDYYFQEDERSVGLQKAYQEMLAQLFKLAQIDDSEKRAQTVYALEARIAKAHWTRVENRDRIKTYNKKTTDEIKGMLSSFDLKAFLEISGVSNESTFIVRQPSFLEGLNATIETVSLDQWKDYFKARILIDFAPYLSDPFAQVHFNFYNKTLGGQEEPEPRARRAVNLVNGSLGELIGKEYVQRHFPPEAKERMLDLVGNLTIAMKESIENLEWMTTPTKVAALEKLKKFSTKIGYPDKWKDYSGLTIYPEDLVGNIIRSAGFEHQREISKLGKSVDRSEWFMTPQTVNAYYNPSMNEIVFPAAILQPPFFNMNADDAINYGAIGMVIGHEIGHGFDDQGRKSDGDGNLRDWWTEDDANAYEARTSKLVAQYEKFEPEPGFFVNGQLTLGENIGDLGGITLSYRAYLQSMKGKRPPMIDDLTGEKRFFLSLAQIWRIKQRPETTIRRLKTDTHSPPKFRVNGPIRNFDDFYKSFNVKEKDTMWLAPEDRVQIW
ncbi:MAG: M13 family metallopeptidase [Verrucomicrobia bacterium]|nr:M13 family metallopeptidase [Verrucomicrobiota bacterium]